MCIRDSYRTIDDLDPNLCGKPVQAFLDGDGLRVETLS